MIRSVFPGTRARLVSSVESTNDALTIRTCRRRIGASAASWARKMPDRPGPVDEKEFTESFLKGSGPGGQKINKTASAVQLKHLPTGIVLKVQQTRSREQNRKLARDMLALRLEEMEKGAQSRVAIVADTKRKRKGSAAKKSRRKYRLLEQGKEEGRKGEAGGTVEPTDGNGS